jgi:type IV fimbrial biogenesis protein FimT
MGRYLARHRLAAAAESLAADLADARFEAARRGQPLHLEPRPAPQWCWTLASAAGCGCEHDEPCQLKAVRAADHRGVRLLEASPVRFDAEGRADGQLGALFESGGARLRVEVSVLGRARICDPDGREARWSRC